MFGELQILTEFFVLTKQKANHTVELYINFTLNLLHLGEVNGFDNVIKSFSIWSGKEINTAFGFMANHQNFGVKTYDYIESDTHTSIFYYTPNDMFAMFKNFPP